MTFDARQPGTTRAEWAADNRWAQLPQLSLEGVKQLVVLAAHPDDETLGAGGLIAECFARSIRLTVVIVTAGDASHPHSQTVEAATMANRRSAEVRAALDLLAPGSRLIELGFGDGMLAQHADDLRASLAELLVGKGAAPPLRTLLVAPWRGDGHPDHSTLGAVAADLAAEFELDFLEYPIWLWHWGSPTHRDTPWNDFVSLPLSEWAALSKDQAISAYSSQIGALSTAPGDEAVLHPTFLANFDRDDEIFVARLSSTSRSTLRGDYFDQAYARTADPWGFESRWYEERKRAVTVASLPHKRYSSAFEIGCSIGVLTADLAPRCDALLSVDIAPAAVELARERLSDQPQVTIEVADVTQRFPPGSFDLIVLSEVAYYLDPAALDRLLEHVSGAMTPTGHLIACHWRHEVADYPQTGDAVHAHLGRHADRVGWTRLVAHVEADFVLEVYSPDPRSVATEAGLA